MALPREKPPTPKPEGAARNVRSKRVALVPNKDSESYKVVDHAIEHGVRVSTEGMSREAFKAALLGKSKAK